MKLEGSGEGSCWARFGCDPRAQRSLHATSQAGVLQLISNDQFSATVFGFDYRLRGVKGNRIMVSMSDRQAHTPAYKATPLRLTRSAITEQTQPEVMGR